MLLKQKVLIAEDDDSIIEMVDIALQGVGLRCMRAENGARGIEMLRLYAPDLLVLDVMMPQMDGIEAAQYIRKDALLSETPILMLTALSTLDNKIDGLDAGADAYLPKPFDVRELAAQAKALLRSRKHGRERHPITSLPGPGAISEALAGAPGAEEPSSVIYLSVRELDRYIAEVDFDRAAAFLESLAEMLQDKMRAHTLFTSFLGHNGGGEFVIVLPSDVADALASDIVESFGSAHAAWLGEDAPVASMTLTAAVAATEDLEAGDVEGVVARLTEVAKAAEK